MSVELESPSYRAQVFASLHGTAACIGNETTSLLLSVATFGISFLIRSLGATRTSPYNTIV